MSKFRDDVIDAGAAALIALAPEVEGLTKTDVAEIVGQAIGTRQQEVFDLILSGINGVWAAITARADALLQARTGTYTYDGVKCRKRELRVTVGDGVHTAGGEVMFLSAIAGPRVVTMVNQSTSRVRVSHLVSSVMGHRRTGNLAMRSFERVDRHREVLARAPGATIKERFDWHESQLHIKAERQFNLVRLRYREFTDGAATDVEVMDAAMPLVDVYPAFVQEVADLVGWAA